MSFPPPDYFFGKIWGTEQPIKKFITFDTFSGVFQLCDPATGAVLCAWFDVPKEGQGTRHPSVQQDHVRPGEPGPDGGAEAEGGSGGCGTGEEGEGGGGGGVAEEVRPKNTYLHCFNLIIVPIFRYFVYCCIL